MYPTSHTRMKTDNPIGITKILLIWKISRRRFMKAHIFNSYPPLEYRYFRPQVPQK